jgi:hypothetical protein
MITERLGKSAKNLSRRSVMLLMVLYLFLLLGGIAAAPACHAPRRMFGDPTRQNRLRDNHTLPLRSSDRHARFVAGGRLCQRAYGKKQFDGTRGHLPNRIWPKICDAVLSSRPQPVNRRK